ncbi:protein tyrosine/serine phosphatase [Parabacteroides sp. PF5-5]|uniref:tyrosine-protein phosphatase n=1 Tax=unclassified Parabacteroides TaxID=2649774 RepID=UPI002474BCB6|nr:MULTISPECIES: tyrosine-protein phosphatase [unclassified Parabacteroides]MDH6303483.1 protein tyrosine/serine phosphatase [Parabacteroides sp. PH5-39]MDH6314805.1 protein tyrosine/serine phosphatase [Parabacteroides sp. PF5-13]MDH6318142.1 protein tyrosine/serine phosphatase [Parabacteroides sp. PH5-13]MDH6321926.1 protein tyrosine/serine phosphatase [Parabacteroides sp. PH5-8]MDH6326050.1 protein tyrosine/serine phosphatase [Parabacteroides sp. PH5-41]
MLIRRILIFVIIVGGIVGCSSHAPEILSLCLRDDIGNYILKWETNPRIEGTLKLYVADDPEELSRTNLAGMVDISNGVTTYVTNDNIVRKYFLLSFNDRYFETVAARSVWMDSVQNLRDLGGYTAGKSEKTTRWGKVYRSSALSQLSERDLKRLDNLKIKTIIDLRTHEEITKAPVVYSGAKIVHIPISAGNMPDILSRIEEGRAKRGDAIVFMQDLYLQYVTECSPQFAQALDVFLDEANYPILFNCMAGKDRTGFMSALLLATLGVSEDAIYQDYLTTNEVFDPGQYRSGLRLQDVDALEAFSVLLTAKESFLRLALTKIKKEYGSIDEYLTKELGVNEKQQAHLKDIMLF